MVEENIMYQQTQKICRGKVYHKKVFRANLGKSLAKHPSHPQKLPTPTLMLVIKTINKRKLEGRICPERKAIALVA